VRVGKSKPQRAKLEDGDLRRRIAEDLSKWEALTELVFGRKKTPAT
jgi:hypothetical protein